MPDSDRFLDLIEERTLLADGAMGTEIYARGFYVNRCYDHLNLTNPDVIAEIHGQYAAAGAEILTTNTFGANRINLTSYGLQESLPEVIQRGVEIARAAAGKRGLVAGSVGPIVEALIEKTGSSEREVAEAYRDQVERLLEQGVDLLLLETYPSLAALELAYKQVLKASPQTPCITSLSIAALGYNPERAGQEIGKALETYVQRIRELAEGSMGAPPVLGLNCGGGPPELLGYFQKLSTVVPGDVKTCAMPNAGVPQNVDGRTMYMASPEYFAEFGRRFVNAGAKAIGGCCGTTPAMIKEMRSYLRQMQPGRILISEVSQDQEEERLEPVPLEKRSVWGSKIGKQFAISVELDPPKGLDITKSIEGAKFLAGHGIDAVNIADGPRATGRVTPTILAEKVREAAEIETIIHVCARDRNILGLQMDIISAHVTGIRNLMLITGDPPKMGLYPDATAVFDMDAIGLVHSAALLNEGMDLALRPVGGQTEFVIGVGCNPGASNLDLEVERFQQKIEAGAEYVFSQPVYDVELLEEFINRTEHLKPIPFFVGILPLASLRNAEFLTKNVPGMEVPEEICHRLALAPTKEAQREEGINIAAEALKHAKTLSRVKGAYIFPPFGRYASILDVLERAG